MRPAWVLMELCHVLADCLGTTAKPLWAQVKWAQALQGAEHGGSTTPKLAHHRCSRMLNSPIKYITILWQQEGLKTHF